VFASSAPRLAGPARLPGGSGQSKPFLQRVGDERLLSLALPVRADLAQPLYALIQGSYDRALTPLHALQWRISAIGLVALAGALLVGMLLADSIVGPVRKLVAGMREVLRGNLRFRARLERQDELGFLARSFNEMVGGLQERERVKDTFGRFVSRDVAEAVLSDRIPLAGERLNVSILFQDIRGFSRLSQTLDPGALLSLLNAFFSGCGCRGGRGRHCEAIYRRRSHGPFWSPAGLRRPRGARRARRTRDRAAPRAAQSAPAERRRGAATDRDWHSQRRGGCRADRSR
jgi:HAMP domain-containing protein